MLRGERVLLRARHVADVPILEDELHNDVATRSRSDTRPWRPVSPGKGRYCVEEPADDHAPFSVVTLADDELAGEAILWGIDSHNRVAHIGISLRPAFRGKGLASDVLKVLCHYGFDVLGLHRLQLETLADNAPMIAAAERAGFRIEGCLRESQWVTGRFVDDMVLGLVVGEWRASG